MQMVKEKPRPRSQDFAGGAGAQAGPRDRLDQAQFKRALDSGAPIGDV